MKMLLTSATTLLRRSALWRQFHVARRHSSTLRSTQPLAISRTPYTRQFATRSASAIAPAEVDACHEDSHRHNAAKMVDAAAAFEQPTDLLLKLEKSIADRQPSQALAYYNCLETPPNKLLSQKLAILLAKQASEHQTRIAVDILLAVFGFPGFEVDDYTHLASIYTMDACLRHNLLPDALEIFRQTNATDVALDLSAYDGLVRALIAKDQIDEAREIITSVASKKLVVLEEATFQPLLLKMMLLGQYDAVIDVIDHARRNGVQFTFETYDPLVEIGEEIDDSDDEELWNTLERFMTYINQALEEDGLTTLSDDEGDDEDELAVEIIEEDDDDDHDHDEDFDDDQY